MKQEISKQSIDIKTDYVAHIAPDGAIQTVQQHSENTAALSESFAVPAMKSICREAGMLHDIGKYQATFQKRIRGKGGRIEHSNCGAKEVLNPAKFSVAQLMEALAIIGHHSGLPDCGTKLDTEDQSTLFGRLKRESEDYSEWEHEIPRPVSDLSGLIALLQANCKSKADIVESFAFLTRYCFSCLTDADTIDTMRAMQNPPPAPLTMDRPKCDDLLNEKLNSFVAVTPLQKARTGLRLQAEKNTDQSGDIYLMNMPTGSGKTLAGLQCALKLTRLGNKKRIIYIIPYNSIIDQTANIFSDMFGDAAQLLRHQSSFSYEDLPDVDEDYRRSAMFACENWDAELIITTQVQFFESIYSSKRGRLRKMHNMADSVLVFDEAHLMPAEFLQPCLRAISFITRYLNSEVIFLTATMPDFRRLMDQYTLPDSRIVDLVPDKSDFHFFKKATFQNLGRLSEAAVMQKAMEYASSLVVVNSRSTARRLYDSCSGNKFYLTTYMTGQDRTIAIAAIRDALNNLSERYPDYHNVPPEERVIVISTSLIEAGVDLDFTAAFRELAGLDNVLQTGGRCNREGRLPDADVFVFEREEDKRPHRPEQNILQGIMNEFPDISAPEAIKQYYDRLFKAKADEIIKHSLSEQCSNIDSIPFSSYDLKMIDSPTVSIAVAEDAESTSLIDLLLKGEFVNPRKLQKYSCTVYHYELEKLQQQGVVLETRAGITVLTNPDYYDKKTGIQFSGKDIFI